MSEITFHDCEFRYIENNELHCKNKQGLEYTNNNCDNCAENVHLNCTNYNPRKDFCLKYFKPEISSMKKCQEKTTYNDKQLQKKWSN